MFNEATSTVNVTMFHSLEDLVLIPNFYSFADAPSIIEVKKHRVTGKDGYEGSN
jgi:hypothetical protein